MGTQAEEARRQLVSALGLEPHQNLWSAGWAESYSAYANRPLAQMRPETVAAQCQALQISSEVTDVLIAGVSLFSRQPWLTQLLWHCYYALFKLPTIRRQDIIDWAMLPAELDEAAPLFYAYVLLAGTPDIFALHAERGIPVEVSIDTLSDLELWIRYYRNTEGLWGFGEYGWLQFHFRGVLYKLGRLQFEIAEYYLDYPVYRHGQTGQVMVLAADGMRFRRDGQCDGANGLFDPQAWVAALHRSPTSVAGYPLHPGGWAEDRPVELPANQWQSVLTRRDPVLGVHIPATGPMDFEDCGRSFSRALPFFAEHFPEFRPRAFICTSWLLDYQLASYLDSTSNVVRFLREWYLLPLAETDDQETFGRVFGVQRGADLASLPQTTSLQRAVVAHAMGGGHWREASGLILPDAHLRWGEQCYQSSRTR